MRNFRSCINDFLRHAFKFLKVFNKHLCKFLCRQIIFIFVYPSVSSTITIQVWDSSLIKTIENAIVDSNLGINPQIDGQLIRLPVPKLSEERRQELTKIASEYAENSKVAIRNIIRDFIENSKKEKKRIKLI